MFRTLAFAALAMAALGTATPAAAAQMLTTYTGSVKALYNDQGQAIDGKSFTATFLYDTTLGHSIAGPRDEARAGGAVFGDSNPVLKVTMTIAGSPEYSMSWTPAWLGTVAVYDVGFAQGAAVHHFSHWVNGLGLYDLAQLSIGGAIAGPQSLTTAYSGAVDPTYYGYTNSYKVKYAVNDNTLADWDVALLPTSITVAAIPEPATWALLIVGLGGTGAMLRRRRVLAA